MYERTLVPFTSGPKSLACLIETLCSNNKPIILYISNLYPHNHQLEAKCVDQFLKNLRGNHYGHIWTYDKTVNKYAWDYIEMKVDSTDQSADPLRTPLDRLYDICIDVATQRGCTKIVTCADFGNINVIHPHISIKKPIINPYSIITDFYSSTMYSFEEEAPFHAFDKDFDFWNSIWMCEEDYNTTEYTFDELRCCNKKCPKCFAFAENLSQHIDEFELDLSEILLESGGTSERSEIIVCFSSSVDINDLIVPLIFTPIDWKCCCPVSYNMI